MDECLLLWVTDFLLGRLLAGGEELCGKVGGRSDYYTRCHFVSFARIVLLFEFEEFTSHRDDNRLSLP